MKAGEHGSDVVARYGAIADRLAARGVDVLLVACTELSMLPMSTTRHQRVVDTLDVLVDETIRRCEATRRAG